MEQELNKLKELIDLDLRKHLDFENKYIHRLMESMEYSLFTGGKRLRPIYGIKTYEVFSENIENYLPYGSAVEMIHTYSLIHDDLPAMDDDDYRRGKKANHIVYGEDIAILAGDALLNLAFETLLASEVEDLSLEELQRKIRASYEISRYAGSQGMIGGQVIDLSEDMDSMDKDKLLHMYKCKTAGLFQAAIVSAAILAGASQKEIEIMREFSYYLGLSYQIQDDILDIKEDKAIDKVTYLSYYSIDRAKKDMDEYVNKALSLLKELDRDTLFLEKLTENLIHREE